MWFLDFVSSCLAFCALTPEWTLPFRLFSNTQNNVRCIKQFEKCYLANQGSLLLQNVVFHHPGCKGEAAGEGGRDRIQDMNAAVVTLNHKILHQLLGAGIE